MKTFIKLFVLFICFLQFEKYYELRKTRFKLTKTTTESSVVQVVHAN